VKVAIRIVMSIVLIVAAAVLLFFSSIESATFFGTPPTSHERFLSLSLVLGAFVCVGLIILVFKVTERLK
jgi:hypothetical protein